MKKAVIPSVFLGLIFLLGCASNIKTKKYTKDNLGDFTTFAYLPSTSFDIKEFSDESFNAIDESLVSTLENEMTEKGYSVSLDNPDLLVLIKTSRAINSEESTKSKYEKSSGGSSGASPNFASTGSSGGKKYLGSNESSTNNQPYKEGDLAVKIYNKETKELVWIGQADDYKSHISDQSLMERMLKDIFNKFPK
ncbi:MAG: DUF4136 domain-containing protein [Bacteroidota bacterium]